MCLKKEPIARSSLLGRKIDVLQLIRVLGKTLEDPQFHTEYRRARKWLSHWLSGMHVVISQDVKPSDEGRVFCLVKHFMYRDQHLKE